MDIKSINPIGQIGMSSVSDPNALRGLSAVSDARARAEGVANQLESVFYGMMIKAMRATVPDGGLLGKGLGGKDYIEMFDQQIAQTGGLPRDPRFHQALVDKIMQDRQSQKSKI